MKLKPGDDYLIPFIVRREGEGVVYLTNDSFFDQNDRKWRFTKDGLYRFNELVHSYDELRRVEWEIQLRREGQRHRPPVAVSKCRYLVAVPAAGESNDRLVVTTT